MGKSTLRKMKWAFTLVEMLVVIFIIALLVGLLAPVGLRVAYNSRNAAIIAETDLICQAIERYKNEIGDYPPSLGQDYSPTNRYNTVLEAHLRKCYPNMTQAAKDGLYNALYNNHFDQTEALTFWLGRVLKDQRDPFGTDPNNAATQGATRRIFYEFDASRLVDPDGDGYMSYASKFSKETLYVYYDSRTYYVHVARDTKNARDGLWPNNQLAQFEGVPQPYFKIVDPNNPVVAEPVNNSTYQLICAGQDGDYGSAYPGATLSPTKNVRIAAQNVKYFPGDPANKKVPAAASGGPYYSKADNDNITNFGKEKTLGDWKD